VIATGARPGKTGGQRELFTEETTTVLVFENGGVLRLAAAVVPGQLLFLTHKETGREVVAQVTRKRDFRPTTCYVEVEFTEPSSGYWGVDFPATPQLVPATAQQKEAAELVHSAKVIPDKSSASAPSAQEVTALKQEVEALREQLELLQTQTAPAHAAPPTNLQEPANSNSPADVSAPASIPEPLQVSAIAEASNQPGPSLPIEVSETSPGPPPIAPPESATLPVEPGGSFSEAHVPKPLIRVNRGTKSNGNTGGSFRAKPLLITLLSAAALLAAFSAAWYLLGQHKPVSASTPPTLAAQPAPAPNLAPPMTAKATNQVNSTPPTVATSQPSGESKTTAQTAPKEDGPQLAPTGDSIALSTLAKSEQPAAAGASADSIAPQERSEAAPTTPKRSAPRASLKTAASSAALPSAGASVVPPKLIKSVRAIASPNALEYFAHDKTATVTLDAAVDATGRVKSMKVLSGPAALRDSAIEALKQYRYEPATSRGKPVASHVTVPIKFLFEP
jgi:protein TonB